jgi:tetratricopeptide (TPR) repeat protein
MDKKLVPLTTLTRAQILAIRPGTYADDDLLDLMQYFAEQEREDREYAAIELILRSPMRSENVDYPFLYHELLNYVLFSSEFTSAIEWALRMLVYVESDPDAREERREAVGRLGETYLRDEQWLAGMGIFTRLIEQDPRDEHIYLSFGRALVEARQNRLAVEVLERGLAILDLTGQREQQGEDFEEYLEEARQELSDDDPFSEVDLPALAALRTALAVSLEDTALPDGSAHWPPIDRLLALDRSGDPAVEAEILAAGKAIIPDLVQLAMDQELWDQSAGPWHAARLLNRMRAGIAPELSVLANWLDRTEGENWREWASSRIGKTGGYQVDELEALARDAGLHQELREAAILELVDRSRQQLLPKERVMGLMRQLINQPLADTAEEELFTANVIGAAVELQAVELLPEIQKAFDEDRVDLNMLDEEYVYTNLNMPRPPAPPRRTDGLYVRLICTVCEREREHFTRFMIVDESTLTDKKETDRTPFIIDHEYICPKCGAVEQYRLDPMDWFRLMQLDMDHLGALLQGRQPEKVPRPNPRVFFVRSTGFGRPMHPLDVVSEYRGRIALSPNNADLHSGLGNSLRFLGRYQQALESYRKAVELDPNNTDYLFEAATAEHDFGDLQAARALYERCLAAGRIQSARTTFNLDENVRASLQGLQALESGERSPWDYQVINASGVRLQPPPRPGLAAATAGGKKDKRRKRH